MCKICSKPLVATRKNHILSARACSTRDVQAIEAALALCRVSLVINEFTEDEWATERATQMEAQILQMTDT